jgi:hypothetical protein
MPNELKFCTSNNLLKHLAGIISPWIDIITVCLNDRDCALSMTDSPTSEGWTQNTNFKENDDEIQETIRIKVAQCHATG